MYESNIPEEIKPNKMWNVFKNKNAIQATCKLAES